MSFLAAFNDIITSLFYSAAFEDFAFIFFLLILPTFSAGSLIASRLYENHNKILSNLKVTIFIVISAFILGYILSIGGGGVGLSGLIILLMAMSLLAGVFAVLIRLLIKESWYPKFLISVGVIIILLSLVFYYFDFGIIFAVPMNFITHEMGYLSRFEAFYKFYLPYLFRISAFFTYGLFTVTLGYILWKRNLDRFYTLIRIETYIFLFFVFIEIVHAFIFGRRVSI